MKQRAKRDGQQTFAGRPLSDQVHISGYRSG